MRRLTGEAIAADLADHPELTTEDLRGAVTLLRGLLPDHPTTDLDQESEP